MDPEEQRPGRIAAARGRRARVPSSQPRRARWPRPAARRRRCSNPRARPKRRDEHERRDERGGPIAGASERFGEQRLVRPPGSARSRARRGPRDRGPSCIELCEGRVSGTVAYAWRKRRPRAASALNAGVSMPFALRSDRVGARRVEGHQQDGGPRRGRRRLLTRSIRAGDRQQQREHEARRGVCARAHRPDYGAAGSDRGQTRVRPRSDPFSRI